MFVGVDYDRTSLIALSKDLPVKLVAYLDHETSAQKWSTLDKAQLLTVPEGIYDLGVKSIRLVYYILCKIVDIYECVSRVEGIAAGVRFHEYAV